jgi:hypothetical protein
MTEAAAHAAAMQAFRDAMMQTDDNSRVEYNSDYENSAGNSMMYESNGGNSSTTQSDFYNSEELRAIHTSQGFDSTQVELLNELMEYQQQSAGMSSPDDATAHELLQLLERQQQEQILREEAAMRAEHDARNRRPEKHYLTIANNGKSYLSLRHELSNSLFEKFFLILTLFFRYIVGGNSNRNWFPTRSTLTDFNLRYIIRRRSAWISCCKNTILG